MSQNEPTYFNSHDLLAHTPLNQAIQEIYPQLSHEEILLVIDRLGEHMGKRLLDGYELAFIKQVSPDAFDLRIFHFGLEDDSD